MRPGEDMITIMRAAHRVRRGEWINGAPSHVLAELLNELDKLGYVLIRSGDNPEDPA